MARDESGAPPGSSTSWPFGTEPELVAQATREGAVPLILVLGATGYVGGRLIPRLVAAGYRVRVLARSGERANALAHADEIDVVIGDASHRPDVAHAMRGVSTVYYLIHSMTSARDYGDVDRAIAKNVASEASSHGVRQLIYLGGLHPEGVELSPHLASRSEVASILVESPTPALVLDAGVIIGAGSASFEMIRHLTEVLPVMPAPKWVRNEIQPISIRDVMYYLLAAARLPEPANARFDIGGPDVMRYSEMMNRYAAVAGLPQRYIAALPVLTPRLASHWVGLVTPVPRQIARPLVESLLHSCVMKNHDIDDLIPPPERGLTGYDEAVEFALGRVEIDQVETSWVDASVPHAPSDPMPSDPDWAGRTVFTDTRERESSAATDAVWQVITEIGGATGWYSASVLWATRGAIDRLSGGVGQRRGRRSHGRMAVGDAIDVWRVEHIDPGTLVRLRAEMKVPGRAWLELGVEATETGSRYRQRAVFLPRGLTGRLYWLTMLPFHGLVFSGMVNRIVATAEQREVRSTK